MMARDLVGGEVVRHSGESHAIMEVRHQLGVTCCITANGGRVSFFSSDRVEVL